MELFFLMEGEANLKIDFREHFIVSSEIDFTTYSSLQATRGIKYIQLRGSVP